ncbi:MAG: aminopeptidase P family protein [Oscillospiraceae bacterium]
MKTKKLIEMLPQNVDAAIITSDINRLFLTDVKSSAGFYIVTREKSYLLVDFRYIEMATKYAYQDIEVKLFDNSIDEIKKILTKHNCKNIAFELEEMSVSTFNRYAKKLERFNISDNINLNNFIDKIREQKDENEIKSIKIAQQMTDETYSYILNYIKEGMTELEIALEMEFYIKKLGSKGVAFDFIVVSGSNSSLPHGVPSDKKIEKGDFLTMDFGAVYNGYRSDMTRTIGIGSLNDEQKNVYNIVLEANKKSIESIRAGVICKDIDKIARNIIYSAGYEGCFGHGLGHSVGLDIHEEPRFNEICDKVLKENVVMTVEPGIYLKGKFGVRIEDMVIAKKDGVEIITKSDKKLTII